MKQLFNCCSLFLLLAVVLMTGCSKDSKETETGNFKITFQHNVGQEVLALNNTTYTNAAGETYTVSTFKYYLSNFAFTKANGQVVRFADKYYLVNEAVTESKTITIPNLPEGDYKSVSFVIGVDSIRNVSGAQTGALDPLNGMFWSWNSGYIMAKFEGASPQSASLDKSLVFHIGGFKGEYNALQTVTMNNSFSVPETEHMVMGVDVATWFTGPNAISFKTMSACHVPGADAYKFAQNYRSMFTSLASSE